jgi:hypothetical protein
MKRTVMAVGLSIACGALYAGTAAADDADLPLNVGQQAGAPATAAGRGPSAEAAQLTSRFASLGLWQAFIDTSIYGEISVRLAGNRTAQGAEISRVAPLEGLVSALSAQVKSGKLPAPAVAALNAKIAATLTEIARVPEYTSTATNVMLSAPETHFLTDVNGRPVWIQATYRGAWDQEHDPLAPRESSSNQHFQLGFLYSPVDRVLLGLSGFYEHQTVDFSVPQGGGTYKNWGVKGDLGVVLTENLGFYLSYQYSSQVGQLAVTTPLPSGPFSVDTPNREGINYAQAQLLGNYTNRDLRFIPQGLSVKPYVAIDFYDAILGTTTNNLGQQQRTLFGTGFERLGLFRVGSKFAYDLGGFVPRLQVLTQLGFEDEFANNTDTVVKGGSDAVIGAGFEYVPSSYTRFSAMYRYRKGITSNRNSNEIQLVSVFSF